MSIKHSLLTLLLDGPHSASQLQTRFEDATDIWSLNIGQVTQTLHRLHRDELIEPAGTATAANGRTVDTYRITDAGRAELEQWFREPLSISLSERDDLVTKVTMARLRPEINIITLLDTQREKVMSKLRELNRASRDLPEAPTTERLLLERRIYDLEAQARWLDRVESLEDHHD